MTFTIEQRKTKYIKMIEARSNELLEMWRKNNVKSKKIVAEAEYCVNYRLKKNSFGKRINVLVLALALERRINTRYKGLIHKLLHLRAYFKERHALKLLKLLLGFDAGEDVSEMISVEMQRLAEAISKLSAIEASKRGGISSLLEFGGIEEELEALLEAVSEEEVTSGGKSQEKDEEPQAPTQQVSELKDITAQRRAEAAVKDAAAVQQIADEPKPIEEKPKAEAEAVKQAEAPRQEQAGKTEAPKEVAPPIAVKAEGKPVEVRPTEQQTEKPQAKTEAQKAEVPENKQKPTHREAEIPLEEMEKVSVFDEKIANGIKNVFPVFRPEGGGEAPKPQPQNVPPRQEGNTSPTEAKPSVKVGPQEVSQVNLYRREINNHLTEAQVLAVQERLMEKAGAVMESVENEWREKISIEIRAEEAQHNDVAHSGAQQRQGQEPVIQKNIKK